MLFGKNGKPSAEKLAAAAAEFYGDANKNKNEKPAEDTVKDSVVSGTEQDAAVIEPEQPVADSSVEEEAVEYGTYERYIADELLLKYENSKAYREGSSSRGHAKPYRQGSRISCEETAGSDQDLQQDKTMIIYPVQSLTRRYHDHHRKDR